MIGYSKYDKYYYITKDKLFLERYDLIFLIGYHKYNELIDLFLLYPKTLCFRELNYPNKICIVTKNKDDIEKAVDYINSILIMKVMEALYDNI